MSRKRWRFMLRRLLLVYAIVELAVIFALISTIGWGWTLLILLTVFVLGWGLLAPMTGSHLVRRFGQLRSGLNDSHQTLTDSAMVTAATVLVLVPGLVTTVLGTLLLVPPIRRAAAPGLTNIALRGLQRRVPLIADARAAFPTAGRRGYAGDGRDYIDGEVVDVADYEPPSLPK